MKLEDIMLAKVSQAQNDRHRTFSLLCESFFKKLTTSLFSLWGHQPAEAGEQAVRGEEERVTGAGCSYVGRTTFNVL